MRKCKITKFMGESLKEMLVEQNALITNYRTLRTSIATGFYITQHVDFVELLEVIAEGNTEIRRYYLINGN